MPKVSQGRLDGVWGMSKFTAEELHALADKHEAMILDPKNTDDPKWLQRRADRLRHLATQKEKTRAHKAAQQRPKRPRHEQAHAEATSEIAAFQAEIPEASDA